MSKATIAIPTHNRAALLRQSLQSALSQDFEDLSIIVLDNASTDDTEVVTKSFHDHRVRYCRSPQNVGMVRNLNRAIELNRTPYLCILMDDDLLLPDFVRKSAQLLDGYPQAGFALARARYIDGEGSVLGPADPDLVSLSLPTGVISGSEYLHWSASARRGGNPSTVLFRASALDAVGGFDSPHCRHTTELNLYLRLASRFDVGFVNEELVGVRLHSNQACNLEWGDDRIGYVAEFIDAIAHLMQSDRAAEPSYREWLSEQLRQLNARQSETIAGLVPKLYWTWEERRDLAIADLTSAVPAGATFILADECQFGNAADLPRRRRLPFTERDGEYWGPPSDDAAADHEIDRMRHAGARYFAIAWPAFWWLNRYPGWAARLQADFRCVLKSSRVHVFDLGEGVQRS